eukprot:TRINITY_DN10527_c0_g1_i1.p1 TRINITY_DN10527_c0_g1~~TRINITY_DN10527_c0_g1_i1.p1  ORF type:complete len:1473 (+),score=275.03 TRINITY_DN10527_c0_g1_i1:114-4532(+)
MFLRNQVIEIDSSSESDATEDEDNLWLSSVGPEGEQEGHRVLVESLQRHSLFRGCDEDLVKEVATAALAQAHYPPSGQLNLRDGMPMMVVVSGEISVCIGCGPAQNARVGSVIGAAGMLGLLKDAEKYKNSRACRSCVMSVFDYESMAQEQEPDEGLRERGEKAPLPMPTDSPFLRRVCHDTILNLVPHTLPDSISARPGTAEQAGRSRGSRPQSAALTGWLRLDIDNRSSRSDRQCPAGYTAVASLTPDLIEGVLAGTSSHELYKSNRAELISRFSALLRLAAFPGVPPEVILAIADRSQFETFAAGSLIAKEAEANSEAPILMIMDSGLATVDKLLCTPRNPNEAEYHSIAYLMPGTIIGDVCYVEAHVSRAASITAREFTRMLTISNKDLIEVMGAYPGMVSIYTPRIRDCTKVMLDSVIKLPDSIRGMKLFYGWEESFIRAVSGISQRKVQFLGDIVKQEGGTDRTLRLQEFGMVRVETVKDGCVAITDVGTVLGEKMFLGIGGTELTSKATFRVATPLALMVNIAQHSFDQLLDAHPSAAGHFRNLKRTDQGVEERGHRAKDLNIFRGCSAGLIEDFGECLARRAYKPWQTVITQRSLGWGSLYIVTSGHLAVFVGADMVKSVGAGESFGELGLLGLVPAQKATVISQSFVTLLELSRESFLQVLDNHPSEKLHFEKLVKSKGHEYSKETWPFIKDAPEKVLYFVNLYARRESSVEGAWETRKGERLPKNAAVLVIEGELAITNEHGHTDTYTRGMTFGEQTLLGLQAEQFHIVAKTFCYLQILDKAMFEKTLAECPDARSVIYQGIKNLIGRKAEARLGIKIGSPDILRKFSLFRPMPESFLREVHSRFTTMVYQPGEVICEPGMRNDSMCIVVRGVASVMNGATQAVRMTPGDSFGEANMLGLASASQISLQAVGLCCLQMISRGGLRAALEEYPVERQLFDGAADTMKTGWLKGIDILPQVASALRSNPVFTRTTPEFVSTACLGADEVFFAPGEHIITLGERCIFGEAKMYIVVAGAAEVKLENGEVVATLQPGALVGEGGALGMAEIRTATIMAGKEGLARCICLQGTSIQMACTMYPECHAALSQHFTQRSQTNAEFQKSRSMWIKEVVTPAVKQCRLLTGFSSKLISKIVEPLTKITYFAGEMICTAGESASSIIFFLKGQSEILSRDGHVLGHLSGGCIGEVALLGMFPWRSATVRAVTAVETVEIESVHLWKVVGHSEAACERLQFLEEERRVQVAKGMPICSLPIDASPEDSCVRAIALHSDRIVIAAGQTWEVPPDARACGPHYWIITRGHAQLLMGPEDHPVNPVATLMPGSRGIVPESRCLKYEARLQAMTPVEAYRVRCSDILLASASVGAKWHLRFARLERETCSAIRQKLKSARTVMEMSKHSKHILKCKLNAMEDEMKQVTLSPHSSRPQTGVKEAASPTVGRDSKCSSLPPAMSQSSLQAGLRPTQSRQ